MMFGKLFKIILAPLRWVYRALSPNAEGMQATLIRMIAGDLLLEYLSRNPKTFLYLTEIDRLVTALRKLTGIKVTTAERIIRAVIQELGILVGPPKGSASEIPNGKQ